ncbi:PKD domain-containing protein, partial [uncultured Methanobrevibacter sp.]|uniref:PKD domain-containing protein n=1 Tax=uncultured Methanobrevibacter sp. TaxID=253161 RepID=UPI00262D72C4
MLNLERLFVFFVLIAFLLSVGGVSAEGVDDSLADAALLSDDFCSGDEFLASDAVAVGDEDSLSAGSDGLVSSGDDLVADFTADTTEGINSLTVNFTDVSGGNPSAWFWDFGDGGNSTLQNPTHTYDDIGYFNVSLKIVNDDFSDFIVKDDFVHVIYDREILANPDFEDGTRLVGWDYSGASVYSSQKNANTGKRFAQLQDGGFISQLVHWDTVD